MAQPTGWSAERRVPVCRRAIADPRQPPEGFDEVMVATARRPLHLLHSFFEGSRRIRDVVGFVTQGGLFQPWLRMATGEQFLLPFVIGHNTDPKAINNADSPTMTPHDVGPSIS